jgi:RHS repeat-associated protein
VGNRLSVTTGGTTTPYTANPLNQYTQVGATPFTYDPNGNLTHDGVQTATYDAANRLTQVLRPGQPTAQYQYDWSNRLLTQQLGPQTTRYTYDGWEVLTEETGASARRYLYGPGLDEVLLQQEGNTTRYVLSDGLGSTIALTDSQGRLVERYAYDVFGTPLVLAPNGTVRPTPPQTPVLFTGRWFHPETGLYDYRNRWYHPGVGRFLQTDPVRYAVWDANLYQYVRNNVANWVDPYGEAIVIPLPPPWIVIALGTTAIVLSTPQGQAALQQSAESLLLFAESTKHTTKVVFGLLAQAWDHLEKCLTNPPNDPRQNHWRKEIRAWLDRARRLAEKRLPQGLADQAIEKLNFIKSFL